MMHNKTKMKAGGGMMKKGYAAGGAMPMKDGKPAFIGDGKGKMAGGGMTKKAYQAGGMMGDENDMMARMGRGMAKAKMEEEMMAGMPQRRMQKGGITQAIKKHEQASPVHKAGLKHGGPAKKMQAGGMAKKMMAGGGMTKKMMAGGGMTKKMQAGGGVTRGDGIVKKGHTQGKMI
jgi:hypothetical protein